MSDCPSSNIRTVIISNSASNRWNDSLNRVAFVGSAICRPLFATVFWLDVVAKIWEIWGIWWSYWFLLIKLSTKLVNVLIKPLTNFYFLATKEKADHSWYSYKKRYVLTVLSPSPILETFARVCTQTHARAHTALSLVSCGLSFVSKVFFTPPPQKKKIIIIKNKIKK